MAPHCALLFGHSSPLCPAGVSPKEAAVNRGATVAQGSGATHKGLAAACHWAANAKLTLTATASTAPEILWCARSKPRGRAGQGAATAAAAAAAAAAPSRVAAGRQQRQKAAAAQAREPAPLSVSKLPLETLMGPTHLPSAALAFPSSRWQQDVRRRHLHQRSSRFAGRIAATSHTAWTT